MEKRRSRDRIICSVPLYSSGDGPDKLAGDNFRDNIPTISTFSSPAACNSLFQSVSEHSNSSLYSSYIVGRTAYKIRPRIDQFRRIHPHSRIHTTCRFSSNCGSRSSRPEHLLRFSRPRTGRLFSFSCLFYSLSTTPARSTSSISS